MDPTLIATRAAMVLADREDPATPPEPTPFEDMEICAAVDSAAPFVPRPIQFYCSKACGECARSRW